MAEFNLLLNQEDTESLANMIFAQGCRMIPDYNYDSPQYHFIESMDEFVSAFDSTRLFFVIHDSWSFEDLEMREFNHKEQGKKYYIVQKTGGPTIDFYSSGVYSKNGQNFLGSGFIGYHAKYWSNQEDANLKCPPLLKQMYKELIAMIKKDFISLKGEKKTYWISKESKILYDSGKLGYEFEF